MPRYNRYENDIIQHLTNKIAEMERAIMHLQNQHNNTTQIHSKGALPADLADGLIFVATDNEFCWVRNGVARSVGGTIV